VPRRAPLPCDGRPATWTTRPTPCSSRAELEKAWEACLAELRNAERAAASARAVSDAARARADALAADVAEAQRRLASVTHASADADMTVRIESRALKNAVEEELGHLRAEAASAGEAAGSEEAAAARAEAIKSRKAASLTR